MSDGRGEFRLTGKKVAIYLVAFFGVIIAVNSFFLWSAISTHPGADVDSPYKFSNNYSRNLVEAKAQAERQWQVASHLNREGQGARFRIELKDKQAMPLTGMDVKVKLASPAKARSGYPLEITETTSGIYNGQADQVPPGQWDLVVEVYGKGSTDRLYRSIDRVFLQ